MAALHLVYRCRQLSERRQLNEIPSSGPDDLVESLQAGTAGSLPAYAWPPRVREHFSAIMTSKGRSAPV